MRVFLTGATGFIGSAIIPELLQTGHQVLGLTRSEEGAEKLKAAGVEVHHGNIEDLESLKSGAAQADAVIHCGFNHDFSKFQENCENDRKAIEAIGEVLVGTDKPFLVTSGVAVAVTPGRATTEDDPPNSPMPRVASEKAAEALLAKGVKVIVVRLPQVHDPYKQGLVPYIISVAREKGVSAYLGDGSSQWSAVHVSDCARLYRLALEKGVAGSRYNAVGEEGVTMRAMAESIARGLKIPAVSLPAEKAAEHFGWLAMFASHDMPASSALTQQRLGWTPTGPTLISDLDQAKF